MSTHSRIDRSLQIPGVSRTALIHVLLLLRLAHTLELEVAVVGLWACLLALQEDEDDCADYRDLGINFVNQHLPALFHRANIPS